jgi:DNA-binding NtrC family response regulator
VLIIDDDRGVADATAMFLDVVGFETIAAADADEACMLLSEQRRRPDVVVCDFHLADGASGVDAIAQVREALRQSIPAILITGDTSAAASEVPAAIEHCELLSKPVETDALVESIRRLLV